MAGGARPPGPAPARGVRRPGVRPARARHRARRSSAACSCPAPFFSTVCLAANAILNAASETRTARCCPASRRAMRTRDPRAGSSRRAPGMVAASRLECRAAGDGFVLDGAKRIVHRRGERGSCSSSRRPRRHARGVGGADAPASWSVEPQVSRRDALEALDPRARSGAWRSRACARRRSARRAPRAPGLERTLHQARTCLAFESAGGAQRCLDMAVAYAKQRVQFGRPIGAFQAIKHKCAEVLLEARARPFRGALRGVGGGAGRRSCPLAASPAKAACVRRVPAARRENLQIHGGVGYTWEYDPHLFYKRAQGRPRCCSARHPAARGDRGAARASRARGFAGTGPATLAAAPGACTKSGSTRPPRV